MKELRKKEFTQKQRWVVLEALEKSESPRATKQRMDMLKNKGEYVEGDLK